MTCFKTVYGMFLVVVLLWACGGDDADPDFPSPSTAKVEQKAPPSPTEVEQATQEHAPPAGEEKQVVVGEVLNYPPAYFGNATLEERIAVADVVARVRFVSAQTSVERYNLGAYDGTTSSAADLPYSPALRFTFDVVEYLKAGANPPNRITAMVGSLSSFDSASDAQDAANGMLGRRNTQWDSREAIVFLTNESLHFPSTSSSGLHFMSLLDTIDGDGFGDMYSIGSVRNRIWLPSTTPSNAQVAGELRFYLEEPTAASVPVQASARSANSASQSASTAQSIGLAELKKEISAVNSMLGSSRKQRLCVLSKLETEREWAFWRLQLGDEPKIARAYNARIESGKPEGTFVFTTSNSRILDNGEDGEDWEGRTWFEGEGADLFVKGEATIRRTATASVGNSFHAQGGKFLYTWQALQQPWATIRPLPEGTYKLRRKSRTALHDPCNYTDAIYDFPATVRVTAPSGTVHEAFFDPVTDGSAVAADSTNGILKPASFTDANSASASLQRIEWASSTVKVKVSPHTGLTGQTVDFIELDGSVSLSLDVDDATVDAANNTLSWSVAEQPWHGGDKLMLRIHKAVPAPQGVVSLSEGTFTVSWSAVTGAADYRAQYRTGGSEAEWTDLDVTTGTSQAFSPEGGVACGTTYEFRVQGRGNGTTYSAVWGKLSESASHTTEACNRAPVFSSATYSFTVAENTAVWQSVGTVSATDPDEGDFVTYHITAGNGAGRFEISSGKDSGLILVWGALDYETTSSYTLTVEARDGKAGGTSSTTVEITITDVAE